MRSKIIIDNMCKLKVGTILEIANDLGCPYKMPSIHFGKYLIDCMSNNLSKEEFAKLMESNEYKQEEEEMKKLNEKEWDEYVNNVYSWLQDNGYIKVLKH